MEPTLVESGSPSNQGGAQSGRQSPLRPWFASPGQETEPQFRNGRGICYEIEVPFLTFGDASPPSVLSEKHVTRHLNRDHSLNLRSLLILGGS